METQHFLFPLLCVHSLCLTLNTLFIFSLSLLIALSSFILGSCSLLFSIFILSSGSVSLHSHLPPSPSHSLAQESIKDRQSTGEKQLTVGGELTEVWDPPGIENDTLALRLAPYLTYNREWSQRGGLSMNHLAAQPGNQGKENKEGRNGGKGQAERELKMQPGILST